MKKDITELFYHVDEFADGLEKKATRYQLSKNQNSRSPTRVPGLSMGEIMTIILMFQESPCRNFKYFYKSYLTLYLPEFPNMPSYECFIALMPKAFIFLAVLLYSLLSPGRCLIPSLFFILNLGSQWNMRGYE
jgi:hypothetical protein